MNHKWGLSYTKANRKHEYEYRDCITCSVGQVRIMTFKKTKKDFIYAWSEWKYRFSYHKLQKAHPGKIGNCKFMLVRRILIE